MRKVLATLGALALAAVLVPVVMPSVGSAHTSVGSERARFTSRFCLPMSVIVDEIQRPVVTTTPQRSSTLAVVLTRASKGTPSNIARAMRDMSALYKALATSKTDDQRTAVAFAHAKRFTRSLRVVIAFYSTHCVKAPVTPSLPAVSAASQTACLADARTLQIAESEYSTFNGSFATMDELVAARLLRASSVFHPAILVGTPPGGYTIVGNKECNDLPVAG